MATFDIRRTAQTISAVENQDIGAEVIIGAAYRSARHIPVVGITGPPGAGKSTLVDRLAVHWADQGKENVAVLAVDPSSPFTDGALLGDRVRMDRAASHPNVFVRSLASRGQLGGLTATTLDIVMVLGQLGFDRVLLETVGAGQTDVSVGMVADVVMVVTVPGLGDQIQADKAGILEIGDLYVVNKADLPGAAIAASHLESSLDLVYPAWAGRNPTQGTVSPGEQGQHGRHADPVDARNVWRPPVLSISAADGTGIAALAESTDDFLSWCRETGRHRERVTERLKAHILCGTQARLLQLCLAAARQRGMPLDSLMSAVVTGLTTPKEATERLVANLLGGAAEF